MKGSCFLVVRIRRPGLLVVRIRRPGLLVVRIRRPGLLVVRIRRPGGKVLLSWCYVLDVLVCCVPGSRFIRRPRLLHPWLDVLDVPSVASLVGRSRRPG